MGSAVNWENGRAAYKRLKVLTLHCKCKAKTQQDRAVQTDAEAQMTLAEMSQLERSHVTNYITNKQISHKNLLVLILNI